MSYFRPARFDELVKWLRDNFWSGDGDGPNNAEELAEALLVKFELIMESKIQ